ncbi:alpha-N-arabinofuranosidase [Enterococcus sp. JM4C]|uniref:glycoside hydrolase family 43 protein n=1 Tax=Candidatus Enterococcus huntleyi TaxID=1857217 RepID=UPI001379AD61|nr:glycoside hydrolase family 43 protein [Enterococcus sp. JM4C]KAF1296095.1 alpha-N-arabinofuranosidase [Enterococcus sp. JM4C]
MKFNNPIITGFNPDPSICRVGEDFYLVTSSFEYFPGLPLYHSKDLVNWEQIGHCITRKTQIQLSNQAPNAFGLYAPTIRYHEGRFYVVCTNVPNQGNFLIWTDDILGEWSDPIFLDLPGIDPSLLFDTNGKVYYTGTHKEIYLCEIDLETGKTSPRVNIWEGIGAADPEGPHLYQKDDYYYLAISEGGTGYGHMFTMARSKQIEGPYQPYENNPVLTNRSLPSAIQAIGHADLVQDSNGNWWAVCLGIRPLNEFPKRHLLGRETFLVPIDWSGEWPVFGNNGAVDLEMVGHELPEAPVAQLPSKEQFGKETLRLAWNTLYKNDSAHIFQDAHGLQLVGQKNTLDDQENVTWIGRRQQAFDCQMTAKFDSSNLVEGAEVGLTVFLNRAHHYEIAVQRQSSGIKALLRQRIGELSGVTKELVVEEINDTLYLQISANPKTYQFAAGTEEEMLQTIGEASNRYVTTEVGGVFTGVFLGMYATGNGQDLTEPITCEWCEYIENKE